MADKVQGNRRTFVGIVVSDTGDKTVVVKVNRKTLHRRYKKYVTSTTRYMAHDPENRCSVGDRVEIIESRPLSKRKRWAVKRQIEVGQG
jgi:small subunit ribosomal protein S17